ncbi:sel1 repeat family protein, partial [Pirellulaceae bacterium]|nr:sel1 repeat family protein [Pirellulaceae bacterium]
FALFVSSLVVVGILVLAVTANTNGVPEDKAEAAKWYRKAAEQGDAKAQFLLGMSYTLGKGVTKDDAEAVKWYRKAAEQGSAKAQYLLGLSYANGDGVLKDSKEAAKWYRNAAEQGFAEAQYLLGLMYYGGEGIPQDFAEAAKLYRKAAEQGFAAAQNNLGRSYALGKGVTKDDAEAAKWYRKAAEQESANAQNNLGARYVFGIGVPQDFAEAAKWYRKAAEQGSAEAQYSLGRMYRDGQGVPKDVEETVKWYRKAAEQGSAKAQNSMGLSYAAGIGVTHDFAEAAKWFRKAAEQESAKAQNNLGRMYRDGQGVPKDFAEAYAWFSVSATGGNVMAVEARDILKQNLSPEQLATGKRRATEYLNNYGKPANEKADQQNTKTIPNNSGLANKDVVNEQPELDSGGFVYPDQEDPNSRPVWGHKNGLRIGLALPPGPNGVIRIYAPFLDQEFPQVVNFITIEPTVAGQQRRDQSELLTSNVRPNQQGLLFWASNTLKSTVKTPKSATGIVDEQRGILRLFIHTERFKNGAVPIIECVFDRKQPYEVKFITHAAGNSKPMATCTLSATMGHYGLLNLVKLANGRIASSQSLWANQQPNQFGYLDWRKWRSNQLLKSRDGRYLVEFSSDAKFDSLNYRRDTPANWQYQGKKAIQYWRSESDSNPVAGASGRKTFWGTDAPMPVGTCFANTELIIPFKPGRAIWFGVRPDDH